MSRIILFLKGMSMGIADVIPGVSGGTIAFILEIYEELVFSISKINIESLKILKKEGIVSFWRYINGTFLIVLISGIFTSILIFSKIIIKLLHLYPILVLAFFFGLIFSSIFFLVKKITKWTFFNLFLLVTFSVIAYFITILEPKIAPDSYFYIFISGFIAIIAMILPGISGAFILLLMGSYEIIIGFLNDIYINFSNSISYLLLFGLGCFMGLISFSKVLSYLFKNHHNSTMSILIGFMIGSLNKIWPWKEILSTRTNSKGQEVTLLERSILPNIYDSDSFFIIAILLFVLGFCIVFLLEKINKKSLIK